MRSTAQRAASPVGGVLVLALLLAARAGAEPRNILRLATIAPEGTAWARELRAFSRDIETASGGDVRIKWYFGGIAGDDVQMMARLERNQIDGAASGGMACQQIAPSMRVMRVQGVFQDRNEGAFVLQRLSTVFEDEFRKRGYVLLGVAGMGPEVVFTREPLRTFEQLRKTRMWRWDLDEMGLVTGRELGEQMVPLAVNEAARAFDDGRVEGFFAIPSAALAFQWFTRALFLTDLHTSYLWGCFFVTLRTLDRLPIEHQKALRGAAAKLAMRFEEVGRQQDHLLLGGLFQKQGVKLNPVSDELRRDFLAAARIARDRLGAKLIPDALLHRVLALLADYRAEHRSNK
jgi:TRAP-type C4-dicarboxylate transport system substrate-binding protein